MESEFWHRKWQENQLGFHQEKINSRLIKFWPALELPSQSRVLVPLCGKSEDMLWLLENGHKVFGIELSEIACEDFFTQHEISHTVKTENGFRKYCGESIELWAGDFFKLTAADVAEVAAVYDRAALIALPVEMRRQYATHMATIMQPGSSMLLITMEYDQQKMKGPPFSVSNAEVEELYREQFAITVLNQSSGPDIVGNLKQRGLETLAETVFRLNRI